MGRGKTVKGEGASQGQDTGDIDGRYSYPLVEPRLEEVRDDSTLVQCTGADRSTVHYHDVLDNPPYSQHLEGEERDDEYKVGGAGLRAEVRDGSTGRSDEVRRIKRGGRKAMRWVRVNLGGRR